MPDTRHSLSSVMSLLAATSFAIGAELSTLVCNAPEYDFGSVPDTALGFSHSFEVKNIGAEPIIITAVRSSCDCLTSSLTCKTVRPGETLSVDTHFSFRNESGPQLRAIHIVYRTREARETDPVSVCTLRLRGSILTPVIRIPNRIDLGLVRPGATVTGEVRLISGRCGPFAIRAVGLERSDVRAEYTANLIETNHAVRLLISAPLRNGPFSGIALANTDLADTPNVPISYSGRVAPLVDIRPASLAVRKGHPLNARITLSSPYGITFRILSATATDPRVSVTVGPPAETATHLTVTADTLPDTFTTALVRLTTDHPVCRMLEIPIRAASRN